MGSQGVHGLLEATGILGPTVAGRVFVKKFRGNSSEMVIRMGGKFWGKCSGETLETATVKHQGFCMKNCSMGYMEFHPSHLDVGDILRGWLVPRIPSWNSLHIPMDYIAVNERAIILEATGFSPSTCCCFCHFSLLIFFFHLTEISGHIGNLLLSFTTSAFWHRSPGPCWLQVEINSQNWHLGSNSNNSGEGGGSWTFL